MDLDLFEVGLGADRSGLPRVQDVHAREPDLLGRQEWAWSVAAKQDGSVWAWGDNELGQLGDGTTTDRRTPVRVKNRSGVEDVAAGQYFSAALKRDGTVWSWGADFSDSGDGTVEDRHTAVRVGGLSGVVDVAMEEYQILAVKEDGSVWACDDSLNPHRVEGLTGVKDVGAGSDHSLAIK